MLPGHICEANTDAADPTQLLTHSATIVCRFVVDCGDNEGKPLKTFHYRFWFTGTSLVLVRSLICVMASAVTS